MTDAIDNLATEANAATAAMTEAVAEFKTFKATVADLTAQLAAATTDPAKVAAIAQQLHDATAALTAVETPASPTA